MKVYCLCEISGAYYDESISWRIVEIFLCEKEAQAECEAYRADNPDHDEYFVEEKEVNEKRCDVEIKLSGGDDV